MSAVGIDVRGLIRAALDRPLAQEKSDEEVAERVLESCDEREWRDIAGALLPDAVRGIRRERARSLERREGSVADHFQRDRDRRCAEKEKRREDAKLVADFERTMDESVPARRSAKAADRRAILGALSFRDPEFLASPFRTGDGREPTWGDATVEDHEARITNQTKLVAGIQRDIDLHREAIRYCRERGAGTLREANAASEAAA